MPSLDPTRDGHRAASDRLRRDLIGWLTTVGSDGRPRSTPVWFHWDGESVLVYSRPGKPKLRNIAANPNVSLHLDDDGAGGDIVILEGRAEIAEDAPPADRVGEYVAKYRERIATNGWTPETFASDYTVAIRISPERFRIW